MKYLQITLQKLISLAVIAVGVALFWLPLGEVYQRVLIYVPHFSNDYLQMAIRYGAGGVIVIAGLLALLPVFRGRRHLNVISFPGAHGPVMIQLDSVEASLNRTLRNRPEVKKISMRVEPVNDNRQVRIQANVHCYTTSAGIRETTARISEAIRRTAVNLLGVEEVTTVELKVMGIFADGPSTVATSEPVSAVRPPVAESPRATVPPALKDNVLDYSEEDLVDDEEDDASPDRKTS